MVHELPVEERIRLAKSLLESAAELESDSGESEIAAAWKDEIKQRLDEIDSGRVTLIPGDQVRAEMIERLSPQARARLRV